MNSWGILGNPSPEKIEEYKEMPYGQFKVMVGALNKKYRGKAVTLSNYKIRIRKHECSYVNAYVDIDAFTSDEAIEKVKEMDKNSFEWHESIRANDKYEYQVAQTNYRNADRSK